jgi:catechol 2,3-dioxygenase-like lactoylglutathione lyase family enzyme
MSITHIGYSVDDIASAAQWFASVLGAGPFLRLSPGEYEFLEHAGRPAVLEHRLAFGQWGAIAVELQHTTAAAPDAVARAVRSGDQGLNHVSYLAADLDAESRRLEDLGMPALLTARTGPVQLSFHEAPGLGHLIELQQRNDFMVDFFATVRAAGQDWDGSDVLRDLE